MKTIRNSSPAEATLEWLKAELNSDRFRSGLDTALLKLSSDEKIITDADLTNAVMFGWEPWEQLDELDRLVIEHDAKSKGYEVSLKAIKKQVKDSKQVGKKKLDPAKKKKDARKAKKKAQRKNKKKR